MNIDLKLIELSVSSKSMHFNQLFKIQEELCFPTVFDNSSILVSQIYFYCNNSLSKASAISEIRHVTLQLIDIYVQQNLNIANTNIANLQL